jgi:hypothetical protein
MDESLKASMVLDEIEGVGVGVGTVDGTVKGKDEGVGITDGTVTVATEGVVDIGNEGRDKINIDVDGTVVVSIPVEVDGTVVDAVKVEGMRTSKNFLKERM